MNSVWITIIYQQNEPVQKKAFWPFSQICSAVVTNEICEYDLIYSLFVWSFFVLFVLPVGFILIDHVHHQMRSHCPTNIGSH